MAFVVNDQVVVKKLGGQTGTKQVFPDIHGKIKTVLGGNQYAIEYTSTVDQAVGGMAFPDGKVDEIYIHAA